MADSFNLLSSSILDRPQEDPLAKLRATADRLKETKSADRAQIRKLSQEFEAIMLGQMISVMVRDIDVGRFGGGFGEKIWRDHLVSEYGRQIAKSGSVGVAAAVERELLRAQGLESEHFDGLTRRADSTVLRSQAKTAYSAGAPANELDPLPALLLSPAATR